MSAAVAAAAAAAFNPHNRNSKITSRPKIQTTTFIQYSHEKQAPLASSLGRYECQKRRDWNTFRQYLRNHHPTLAVSRCSGTHVIEFLRYLDNQFRNTKVHYDDCPLISRTQVPQLSCFCPLRQAWASVDGLIGRLFVAYGDNGGLPGKNPFGAPAVRLYLVEVRDSQAKASGVVKYKKRQGSSRWEWNRATTAPQPMVHQMPRFPFAHQFQ